MKWLSVSVFGILQLFSILLLSIGTTLIGYGLLSLLGVLLMGMAALLLARLVGAIPAEHLSPMASTKIAVTCTVILTFLLVVASFLAGVVFHSQIVSQSNSQARTTMPLYHAVSMALIATACFSPLICLGCWCLQIRKERPHAVISIWAISWLIAPFLISLGQWWLGHHYAVVGH